MHLNKKEAEFLKQRAVIGGSQFSPELANLLWFRLAHLFDNPQIVETEQGRQVWRPLGLNPEFSFNSENDKMDGQKIEIILDSSKKENKIILSTSVVYFRCDKN